MSVRFVARVKRVGVCKEAATVCPILTLRAMTIPSKGLRITVLDRLYCACSSWPVTTADLRLGDAHLGLRGEVVLLGGFRRGRVRVHLVLVDQALLEQGFVPLHRQVRQVELGLHLADVHRGAVRICLRQHEVGLGGVDRRLVGGRVEVGQDLPLAHLGVEIHVERPDRPGNLAPDQDLRHGIDDARLTDRGRDVRIGDGPRDVADAVSAGQQAGAG